MTACQKVEAVPSTFHFHLSPWKMKNYKAQNNQQFERHIIGHNTYKFNIYTRGGIDDTKGN